MTASITKDPRVAAIISRAKAILLQPAAEWDKIESESPTVVDLFRNYALILAAVPAVCGFVGGFLFGYGFGGFVVRPTFVHAISAAIGSYVSGLVCVAAIAFITDALAPKFGGKANQVQAFKLAVYSMTASWLAGVFALLPSLGIVLTLLGLYSFYLYYLGLPKLMKVPQDKAALVTVVVTIVTLVIMVLTHRLAYM